MTAPTHQTIDLGHIRLQALTWGPDDGPLALCLHGFPDSAWTWRHLGPVLADAGYRVVAPFTRGYAPSEIPVDRDYHVEALMYDALALHHALGGGDDAVLIGHDWGALTAHGVGFHAGTPFRAMVAMAVPPVPALRRAARGRGRVRIFARQALMSWYMVFNQLPLVAELSIRRLIPLLWRRWSPRGAIDELRPDVENALAAVPGREHASAVLGYYRATLRSPRPGRRYEHLAGEWLQAPRVPTLYLHGSDDGCMQARFVDTVREVLPPDGRAVVVAGAGHFAHLDRHDEVAALITDFLGPV
ncbi:alpha/beta fold hydrolase [Gordonia soli]|uniref:Putative hydrolase n=1 Tax=Gordonia soli NBRC 108243 TaxID=1223545 RepID=M0QF09_9ACTN|nr:alpha/beta fold hydrolase [Gordonia soli]GAC67039.1 putative hydrolase [Gordonia soli NBRC 108243]